MQKNTTSMSDRVRGILSDLSSFIGKDSNSAALPACESRDRDLFIKRVHSFHSSTWFAKPHWLSPITCARYGWMNVDIDLLHCVGCQSVLVVRTPSSFDPAIYDACQKRLEDQLKRAAHHPCCTWPSCPTPEVIILAHSASSSQAVVVEDFINKAVLLNSVGKDLPAVEHSSLSVSESDVSALCSLITNSPKFLHDTEIPGALQSAVLLALAGWDLSDGGKAVPGCTSLQCSLCMRQPGLWNYISITDGNDREPSLEADSHGESLLDHEVNAEKEPEELQTAANHSPCAVVDSQLSPNEVVGLQSAEGNTSFPALLEGSLPLLTTDKCMDLQESLLSSQDVESFDESQDRLPSIGSKDGEPCPLAVNSDKDDNTESMTDDMTGVADTDERGDLSDATADAHKSFSGFLPSESQDSTSSEETRIEQHKDGEPSPVGMNSDKDGKTEAVTNDITGVADTGEHGDHSDVTADADESLSGFLPSENKDNTSSAVFEPERCTELADNLVGNENMAYAGLQMTDSHLPCDPVQQEPDTLDIDMTEETRLELNKNDSDKLDVCPEFDDTSNRKEIKPDAAGNDAEEITDDSADILTARDEHTRSCEPCSDVVDDNPDQFSSSDNVEEEVHNSSQPEDLSCMSLEPPISAVDDSETTETVCMKEARHEAEGIVQHGEQNEGTESDPQEYVQKSADVDTEAAALDLTVR